MKDVEHKDYLQFFGCNDGDLRVIIELRVNKENKLKSHVIKFRKMNYFEAAHLLAGTRFESVRAVLHSPLLQRVFKFNVLGTGMT